MILPGVIASSGGLASSFESIQTYTLSTDTSSITFSSIAATFSHLQIRAFARTNRNDTLDYFQIQCNGDTAANYVSHFLYGEGGGSAAAGANTGLSSMRNLYLPGNNATASVFGTFIVDILDYTSTNKTKVIRSLGGFDANGSGIVSLNSGMWTTSNAAIYSITLTPISSNSFKTYSSFALYGVKA